MATVVENGNANVGECENIVDEKKIQVTEKLQKRQEERLADIERKKEEKDENAGANENVNFFDNNFNREKREIESKLSHAGSVDKNKLTDHFDSLLLSLQKMQKFVTDYTMFIPVRDLQRSQDTIRKLQGEIEEKRDELIPKKKFAFKTKKKTSEKTAEQKTEEKHTNKPVKVDMTDCSFADFSNQDLVKNESELNDKDVALARLADCTIKLYGAPGAVHINNLKNCKIFSGPVSGSVFIDDCKNCTFVMPCQQMRIHSTSETDFYIHVTSRAIIEDCSNVSFAPYNWTYPDIDKHYKVAGLDRARNNWNDVDDFNWLASDKHSPNWAVILESDRVKQWDK